MAKNKKMSENEDVEIIEPDTQEQETTEEVAEPVVEEPVVETPKGKKKGSVETKAAKDKNDKQDKNAKQGKDKNKGKNNAPKKEKKSLKKKASEVWSELKKVSRPTFGQVVKNTCVVIAVVAVCTLLLFGVDRLFSLVYNLLLP